MAAQITRKGFLGMSVAAAGTGLLGTTAAKAEEAAPAIGAVPETWDYEADLVVLGLGMAGIRAACAAAENGMSCVVLEKGSPETCGGDSRCNHGGIFATFHTKEQTMAHTYGDRTEEFCQFLENQCTEIIEWLEEGGCTWAGDVHGAKTLTSMIAATNGGPELYQAALNRLAETDAQVLYETPATHIIRSSATGEVVGVYAEQEGAQIAVKAKKGVVIATGSYTCNDEMLQSLHYPGVHFYPLGGPHEDGDGLKMAAEIGAQIGHIGDAIEYVGPVIKEASEACGGLGVFECWPEFFMHGARIHVNALGQRFMNEDDNTARWMNDSLPYLNFDHYQALMGGSLDAGYVNLPMYLVFDQACFDAGSIGNTMCSWSWTRLMDYNGYVWSEDNKAELEAGWIKQADTLAELADILGVDADGLTATVQEYNAGCEAGVDALGRDPKSIEAFGDGPYYGLEIAPGMIYTIGGLVANSNVEALDVFGNVIPRLFVAGNVGPGMWYPLGVDGCAAEGLLAAQNCAKLEAWDA